MEKQVPHYDLTVIKTKVMQDGILVFTATARQGASALGLSELDAISGVEFAASPVFQEHDHTC